MSTILSVAIGAMRRQHLLDAVLNNWVETMTYAALCRLIMMGFDWASHFEASLAILCSSYEIVVLPCSNSNLAGGY
jgi:hypothetical protein